MFEFVAFQRVIGRGRNLLGVTLTGSVLGLAATSWEEDFLGMRNEGVIAFGGANGLVAVAMDGLVSFAASRGGDATCGLLGLAPDGIERVRCFKASLIDDGMLPVVGTAAGMAVAVVDAVVVVAIVDADDDAEEAVG